MTPQKTPLSARLNLFWANMLAPINAIWAFDSPCADDGADDGVAATLMNFPIFIIIRQLTHDIEADNITLGIMTGIGWHHGYYAAAQHNRSGQSGNRKAGERPASGAAKRNCEKIARGAAQYLWDRAFPDGPAAYAPLALIFYPHPHKKSRAEALLFSSPPLENWTIRNAPNWWPDFWRLAGQIWSNQSLQRPVYIPRLWGCAPK